MQMRVITPPSIAAMATMIVCAMAPRVALAQQCRRTCEAGETRDVRGCCVPKAAPKPAAKPERKREPRKESSARAAPEAEAPAAKPAEPPAARPSENKPSPPRSSEPPAVKPTSKPETPAPGNPATVKKPEGSPRMRGQREPDRAQVKPAARTADQPVPSAATPEQPVRSTRSSSPKSVPEKPAATPVPGQPPGSAVPASIRTEPPVPSGTEPSLSRPHPERPDTRPGKPALRPSSLAPGIVASQQDDEPVPTRRWPVWMPWAVVGAGAVVTGAGGLLYNTASNEYASFDKVFDARCMNGGCHDEEVPDLADQLDRARTLETMSRVSSIVGGAAVIGGAVLVFLNQTAEPTSERATARTFVVPHLGPNAAGIAAGISF